MRIELISTGDELLTGDITDTNASWLAQLLTEQGFKLAYKSTVAMIWMNWPQPLPKGPKSPTLSSLMAVWDPLPTICLPMRLPRLWASRWCCLMPGLRP